ncbi:MAG: alcohol dehydrogenase catalytic domain-containing protein [Lachnospiraceae bacterium]|jgi:2-desacetyl-2-hydroxyethyl bacteriochlorophyllide A dehydrogenase|nr:alcohol dehydrogenase catalytic domain-containing protein [Lachnospiraceae bacterium]
MKALVYTGPEKVEVQDLPIPELKEGQVRIRVTYCGICGSDIGIYSGKHPRAKAPLVLGHEFIGTIEEQKGCSGSFKNGERVVAYPLLSCGHCIACQEGRPNACKTLGLIGIDVDGGIAEYVNCDESVLFRVDPALSDKAAAVIEPLAVIVRTMHLANIKALDTAVVIGAGPIGALTVIMLKHIGAARIIVSDVDEARLSFCKEFGAETVNAKEKDLVEYVNETTDGDGVDLVFECSGSEPAALQVTKVCRIGGTICMTSVHKMPHAVNLQDLNFKEQTMVGSRCYTPREFGQAVEYAKVIASDLERVVSHIVPMDDSYQVFDMIKDPKENTIKVLVDCK